MSRLLYQGRTIRTLDFLCADEMPEDWLDEIYGAIANVIDIDGIEDKINKVLQNAYAWDCGEVVIID
jgi:hypothetical protein